MRIPSGARAIVGRSACCAPRGLAWRMRIRRRRRNERRAVLLEPGPLSPLDPDRVLPPRLTFGFEAIAANPSQQIENARAAIASAQSQMAGDLGGGAGGALDTLLARAATAHAGQVGAGPFTLATHLDTAG